MEKGIAIKPARVRVSTNLYEAEHGIAPTGEKGWLFRDRRRNGNGRTFTCSGWYGKAKRKARRKAAARGIYDIEVMP